MKLWEKGIETHQKIMDFTVGDDRELDLKIAKSDVIASIAHVKMLRKTGLLTPEESKNIGLVLEDIFIQINEGKFIIEEGVEDIHSQLEKLLVEKTGDSGKKVHTARSRNDQVLVDLKLYFRDEIINISLMVARLVDSLLSKAEETKDIPLPGYTHLQAAMKSSFGLWFSAWGEAFTEDLYHLNGVLDYVNLNPLGSAAGYGSSFPIDREYTTRLLEFKNMHVNSVNAQLSRGKTEKMMMAALSSIAGDLSKMSMDLVLFLNQNFNFISLGEELTTGSSIMPHKKNPDVLELLRAKTNRIQAREFEILTLINNLPSGYHRDFQLLKNICFPAIQELKNCLEIMTFIVPEIEPHKDILEDEIYRYLGSVDAINQKVKHGLSFRDAYREVATEIKEGTFKSPGDIQYMHSGSIGNLALDKIRQKLKEIQKEMEVEKYLDFHEKFIAKSKVEEV
ncbi:MAG: argininosuccinate lyase [Bacteroidales bacterium]